MRGEAGRGEAGLEQRRQVAGVSAPLVLTEPEAALQSREGAPEAAGAGKQRLTAMAEGRVCGATSLKSPVSVGEEMGTGDSAHVEGCPRSQL